MLLHKVLHAVTESVGGGERRDKKKGREEGEEKSILAPVWEIVLVPLPHSNNDIGIFDHLANLLLK